MCSSLAVVAFAVYVSPTMVAVAASAVGSILLLHEAQGNTPGRLSKGASSVSHPCLSVLPVRLSREIILCVLPETILYGRAGLTLGPRSKACRTVDRSWNRRGPVGWFLFWHVLEWFGLLRAIAGLGCGLYHPGLLLHLKPSLRRT